jgi:hypothetical protein
MTREPVRMTERLIGLVIWTVLAIALLAAVGPTIVQLAGALVPLVLVVGVVAAVLRCVWFYTQR